MFSETSTASLVAILGRQFVSFLFFGGGKEGVEEWFLALLELTL